MISFLFLENQLTLEIKEMHRKYSLKRQRSQNSSCGKGNQNHLLLQTVLLIGLQGEEGMSELPELLGFHWPFSCSQQSCCKPLIVGTDSKHGRVLYLEILSHMQRRMGINEYDA